MATHPTLGRPNAALNQLVARQTATRNRPGGWWVAAADPHAARHAVTATVDRAQVRRAAAFIGCHGNRSCI